MTAIPDPRITWLPAQACPVCGATIDFVSDFAAPEGPQVGDLCVCNACAGVLRFTDDRTLRVPSAGELVALPRKNRREIARYRWFLQVSQCAHTFPPDADACTGCGISRAGSVLIARGPGDA